MPSFRRRQPSTSNVPFGLAVSRLMLGDLAVDVLGDEEMPMARVR